MSNNDNISMGNSCDNNSNNNNYNNYYYICNSYMSYITFLHRSFTKYLSLDIVYLS